jgi:hypothetical protein
VRRLQRHLTPLTPSPLVAITTRHSGRGGVERSETGVRYASLTLKAALGPNGGKHRFWSQGLSLRGQDSDYAGHALGKVGVNAGGTESGWRH